MRKYISIFLVFSYLTAAFHFSMPYLSYYANYTYFSEEVCINKHNPDLDCNGSCQLKKMVHHQHDDTTPDEGVVLTKNSSTIFYTVTTTGFDLQPDVSSRTALLADPIHSQFITEPATPPPLC